MSLGGTAYQLLQTQSFISNISTIKLTKIPSYKYLLLKAWTVGSSNSQFAVRFNNDSAANYSNRFTLNGAADTTEASSTSIHPIFTNQAQFTRMYIINSPTREKLCISHTISANTIGHGNIPFRQKATSKWANTTVFINEIDLLMGSGVFLASMVSVWGSN